MKVTMPTELQVMGQTVNIEYMQKVVVDDEELSGCCQSGENRIMISLSENKTAQDLEKTLAHELFHFVMAKTGMTHILSQYEEALTVAQEENFIPLFRFDRRRWTKKIKIDVES